MVREAGGASQCWAWWAVERDLDLKTKYIRKSLKGCRLGSNLSHVLNLQSSTVWAMDCTSGKSGRLLLWSRPELLVA